MSFKIRRGTEAERAAMSAGDPAQGEPLWITDTSKLWIGDGVTAGGVLATGDINAVDSVFGRTGAVTAQAGDYTTTLVTEGTNLYFTDARVEANANVSAAYSHINLTTNPHAVTKAQVGLGNVANVEQVKIQVNSFTGDFTQALTPTGDDMVLLQIFGSGAMRFATAEDLVAGTGLTLPDQTGHSGEFLTTNGTTPSWSEIGSLGTIDHIQFSLSPTVTMAEGVLAWDSDEGTLQIGMPGGNVNLQVGQEQLIRVRNTTGATIYNGTIVYINGSSGNRPTCAISDASGTFEQRCACAILTEDIANNGNGYATTYGIVHDLNTSAYPEGTVLYLADDGTGGFTSTPPSAPDAIVVIGRVINSHAVDGEILFNPQASSTLSRLSDVNGTTPDATNKHLIWDNANQYWDAGQIAHGDLSGIGTYTHPSIDSHIDDTSDPHGTIPSQSTHAGEFLTTNGSTLSWSAVDVSGFSGGTFGTGTYTFPDDVRFNDDIYINYDNGSTDSNIWFHDGKGPAGSRIYLDQANAQFVFTDALQIGGDYIAVDGPEIAVNASASNVDSFIQFGHSGAHDADSLMFDYSADEFVLSNDLNVTGQLSADFCATTAYIHVAKTSGAVVQNIGGSTGTTTTITWDSQIYYNSTYFTHSTVSATDRVLCKQVGRYQVIARVGARNSGSNRWVGAIYITSNGTEVPRTTARYYSRGVSYGDEVSLHTVTEIDVTTANTILRVQTRIDKTDQSSAVNVEWDECEFIVRRIG